ncbi:hypothetical protein FOA52_000418 [Chlamydomonas sp. UWO 241]|nr:hypothetical protein FOA52_000418 [Chlamydomonas sp. UWO 241]
MHSGHSSARHAPVTATISATSSAPTPKGTDGDVDDPPPDAHHIPPSSVGRLNLSYACCTQAGLSNGKAKDNQDSWVVREHVGGSQTVLLGVFDGHGEAGQTVSSVVAMAMPKIVERALEPWEDQDARAPPAPLPSNSDVLAYAFSETSSLLSRIATLDLCLSGSTAVVAMLDAHRLVVANLGDSRCVLGRLDRTALPGIFALELSNDHKPELLPEAARVLAAGGRIAPYALGSNPLGGLRVWLADQVGRFHGDLGLVEFRGNQHSTTVSTKHNHSIGVRWCPTRSVGCAGSWPTRTCLGDTIAARDLPGLSMTRCFGDTIAARVGVTDEPEILDYELHPDDRYLLLLSDGVSQYRPVATALSSLPTQGQMCSLPASTVMPALMNARWCSCCALPHRRYLLLLSDGVSQFIDSAELIEMVHHLATEKGMRSSKVAQEVVREARLRWAYSDPRCADDCTCIVVFLEPCCEEADAAARAQKGKGGGWLGRLFGGGGSGGGGRAGEYAV